MFFCLASFKKLKHYLTIRLLFRIYDNNFAMEHIHTASENEFSCFLGNKFNRDSLIQRQGFSNFKITYNDFLQAAIRIFTQKTYFCGFAFWNGDNFRGITAVNNNVYLQ